MSLTAKDSFYFFIQGGGRKNGGRTGKGRPSREIPGKKKAPFPRPPLDNGQEKGNRGKDAMAPCVREGKCACPPRDTPMFQVRGGRRISAYGQRFPQYIPSCQAGFRDIHRKAGRDAGAFPSVLPPGKGTRRHPPGMVWGSRRTLSPFQSTSSTPVAG